MALVRPTSTSGELGQEYKTRIDKIKSIDLKEFVKQDSGLEPVQKGKTDLYHSPFRPDRRPSFGVTSEFFFDFSTREKGDIFDYVRLRLGLVDQRGENFTKILNYIDNGGDALPIYQQYTQPQKQNSTRKFSIETVWQSIANRDRIKWYLQERGISDIVAEKLDIGGYKYPVYHELDGELYTFYFDAVSFPNVYLDDVRNFKMRLVTKDAWMQWVLDQDQNILDKFRNKLAKEKPKYNTLSMASQEAMLYLYLENERKYVHLSGGSSKLYGHQCLYVQNENKITPRSWTFVFWVETELDCAMLQSLGYPAISQFNLQINLNPVRQVAKNLIVIPDNDSAGRTYLKKIRGVFSSAGAIKIPDNYKDIGELYQDQKAYGIHKLIYDQLKYDKQVIYEY